MTLRRVKSYSAQTGYVYQYQLEGQRKAAAGSEYIFLVSRDRKHSFPLTIRLRREAVAAWAGRHGRVLTGTEEYAAVKMRLFHAFDEIDDLERAGAAEVTPANLDELLAELDIA